MLLCNPVQAASLLPSAFAAFYGQGENEKIIGETLRQMPKMTDSHLLVYILSYKSAIWHATSRHDALIVASSQSLLLGYIICSDEGTAIQVPNAVPFSVNTLTACLRPFPSSCPLLVAVAWSFIVRATSAPDPCAMQAE